MRTFKENKHYLCGLGNYQRKVIEKHRVGLFKDGLFEFPNGEHCDSKLAYRDNSGSNATCVLTAKILNKSGYAT